MADRFFPFKAQLPPVNGRFIFCAFNAIIATILLGLLVLFTTFLRLPLRISEKISVLWASWILWSAQIRVVIHGLEHLPSEPAVLVCNHQGMFDILVLIRYLPRPPVFIAKQELFKIPIFGQGLRCLGHIPIDRRNKEKAINSIQQGTKKLHKNNQQVMFFPEGTRTKTGEILAFKKGAFVFAKESGLPIIPMIIEGSFKALPPGVRVLQPGVIHLKILPPCFPDRFAETESLMNYVREQMCTHFKQLSSIDSKIQNLN